MALRTDSIANSLSALIAFFEDKAINALLAGVIWPYCFQFAVIAAAVAGVLFATSVAYLLLITLIALLLLIALIAWLFFIALIAGLFLFTSVAFSLIAMVAAAFVAGPFAGANFSANQLMIAVFLAAFALVPLIAASLLARRSGNCRVIKSRNGAPNKDGHCEQYKHRLYHSPYLQSQIFQP